MCVGARAHESQGRRLLHQAGINSEVNPSLGHCTCKKIPYLTRARIQDSILKSFHCARRLGLLLLSILDCLAHCLALEPPHGRHQITHPPRIVMALHISLCAADSFEIILGHSRLALEEARAVFSIGYPLERLRSCGRRDLTPQCDQRQFSGENPFAE